VRTSKRVRESGEWLENYVWGELLVPEDECIILPFQMKLLHDKVVKLGGYECNAPTHFTAKVPETYHVFSQDSEGKFILGFLDIFHMFNLNFIGPSLVRLWVLYQAKENRRLNSNMCAVIDPFYMHKDNALLEVGRKSVIECLIAAMVSHKEISYLLIPYLLIPYHQW
jgi:hypothetical protein